MTFARAAARPACVRSRFRYSAFPRSAGGTRAAARGGIARFEAETGECEEALATIAEAAAAVPAAGDDGAALATALREAGPPGCDGLLADISEAQCWGIRAIHELAVQMCQGLRGRQAGGKK